MSKISRLAFHFQKLLDHMKLPVFEQVGFSLYSFIALALVWADQDTGTASKELAGVSALHLAIPFLALTFGWEKNNLVDRKKLFFGSNNLTLSLVTVIWTLLILFGLNANIDPLLTITIIIGAYTTTVGSAVRWQFLNRQEYRPLITASLASAGIFALVSTVSFGFLLMPVLTGLAVSRIAYIAILWPFLTRLPHAIEKESHIDTSRLAINKIGLAAMQYLRQNGAVPVAAFFIPESTLIIGRVFQLFGNLVRMAMVPVGNMLFFGNVLQPRQFVLIALLIAAGASIIGIAAESFWLQTGSILIWVSISLSAFISYAALLTCRVKARPSLALLSETGAVVGMLVVLTTLSQKTQIFSYAVITADILAAIIVYSQFLPRKAK